MKNACFIYEDTFINLLTVIAHICKTNYKPLLIKNRLYTPTLLDEIIRLELKDDENIIKNIKKSFGFYALKCMYYTFLSNEENKELIIYYFFLNCIKYREQTIYMRNLRCVDKILKTTNYVAHENHKYKGFLRFKELENHILYAEFEPTNDILFLLSHHFKQRLKQEYWIIKDKKRGLLSIYDKKNFYLVKEEEFTLSTSLFSSREYNMEDLWKTFYQTIGIKERKNDRCRMNFMPKKYWKYMIEMEGNL